MRVSGAAVAATLVTFMAMIGPQSAAKDDSPTPFLRVDHGDQVSQYLSKEDYLFCFIFLEWQKQIVCPSLF